MLFGPLQLPPSLGKANLTITDTPVTSFCVPSPTSALVVTCVRGTRVGGKQAAPVDMGESGSSLYVSHALVLLFACADGRHDGSGYCSCAVSGIGHWKWDSQGHDHKMSKSMLTYYVKGEPWITLSIPGFLGSFQKLNSKKIMIITAPETLCQYWANHSHDSATASSINPIMER